MDHTETLAAEESYAPPMGPRFSQLYESRGNPTKDSPRLRNRIAEFFKREMYNYTSAASDAIATRIGPEHHLDGYASSVARFLKECSPADFRDAITVIHWGVMKQFRSDRYVSTEAAAGLWMRFCRDAFIEENVSYRVDSQCVVRPFVDEEFSKSATALLRGLTDTRLAAVRAEVDTAIADLGGRNPDYKGSVRAVFEAIEIYAKLAVETCTVKRLNRNIVMEHVVRSIQSVTPDDPAKSAVEKIGESLVDWIDACHVYRHGQEVSEPAPPPPELAIALVSNGLSHLRWLLDSFPLPKS